MNTYHSTTSRNARRLRSHWPVAPKAKTAPLGVNASFTPAHDLFVAHQYGEVLHIGLFVVSTLAACVALVLG